MQRRCPMGHLSHLDGSADLRQTITESAAADNVVSMKHANQQVWLLGAYVLGAACTANPTTPASGDMGSTGTSSTSSLGREHDPAQ